jgi:hypothetical protein
MAIFVNYYFAIVVLVMLIYFLYLFDEVCLTIDGIFVILFVGTECNSALSVVETYPSYLGLEILLQKQED